MNADITQPEAAATRPPSSYPRLLLALAIGISVGTALTLPSWHLSTLQSAHADVSVPAPAYVPPERVAPSGFSGLIERVKPAVVTIATRGEVRAEGIPGLALPADPRASEFLHRFFGLAPGQGPLGEFHALGSGFIVDPAGYVVTNDHVIDHAAEITVVLADGRREKATLIGRDARTDLAVLKIDTAQSLPTVALGDSDRVHVGDWVVAIGNPFGLGGTATAGIVSARGRDIGEGPYDDFLQIDAPINQGNSGGPLFDVDGSVVGVNTAIFSPNGGSVGIGFAIPAKQVRSVVEALRSGGKVERGYLGLQYQPLDADSAESLGLADAQGDLVAAVVPGSPAARDGVAVGDVITAVDGRRIEHRSELSRAVAEARPGTALTLSVWRDGSTRTITVAVGKAPDEVATGDAGPADESGSHDVSLGLALAPLTDSVRQEHDIAAGTTGTLVLAVREGSKAEAAGLRPGDVIVRFGSRSVARPEDVQGALAEAAAAHRGHALLLVEREGDRQYLTVPLG